MGSLPASSTTTTTTTTTTNPASILHQLLSPEVTAHIAIPGAGADKLGSFSLKQQTPPTKPPPPAPQSPPSDSLESLVPAANDALVNKALRRMRSFYRAEKGQVQAIKPAERVQARAWAIVCLVLLMTAAPLFLLLAAVTWALGLASEGRRYGQPTRGWALVTGAHMSKGLQLCRHLNAAGYKVIAVEYPGWWMAAARWSRAVSKFETVPCPNVDEMGYVQGLIDIVTKNDVKLVVSSSPPNHAIYDAIIKAALPKSCRSLNIEAAFTAQLDDKWEFSELCQQLKLEVPAAYLVTSRARLRELNSSSALKGRRFILKSIAYDSFARTANIFLPCSPKRLEELTAGSTFSEDHAWMLQELQSPEEYSSYSVASHGRLVAHCDTAAEMNNVRFAYVGLQEIHDWVAKFCAATQLDGQVCFDFMRGFDGVLRCTECNPRASAVMASLHNQAGFATALASPDSVRDTVLPKAGAPGQVCLTHEVVHNMPQGRFRDAWVALLTGRDAVLSASDPWPFIMLHLLQVPVQLVRRIKDGRPWSEINWNIGKVLELGGD